MGRRDAFADFTRTFDRRTLDSTLERWTAAMRRGDFESAWRETDRIEWPRRAREALGRFVRRPEHLLWNGAPLDGRNVLVRCRRGLGDTIQFIRFLPLVRERARSVTVFAPPALVELLRCMPDIDAVHDRTRARAGKRYDSQIEVMELAYVFRTTLETLPNRVPYLPIDAIRACGRAPRLDSGEAPRVGLLWWDARGWDKRRAVPLDALAPLRATGATFYSLQQGVAAERWREAPFPLVPLSTDTREVLDAAAAILELDLVIAVDSMIAHLAGALARPVWVMLKYDADWRWMRSRTDSPWYPTMRLFRQRTAGDWAPVVADVARALRAWASAHSPSAPGPSPRQVQAH